LIVGVSLLGGLVAGAGLTPESRYLALLLGATSGFLLYNVYPASIFMGDGGSLFLGLTLAALTLSTGATVRTRPNVLSIVAAPVLVLLIPIFDTTLVTISRLLSGRPVSQGGRDHSSHRLVAIGLSERAAVGVLWTLAAVAGLIGFAVRRVSEDWSGPIAAVAILAMVVFAVYLAHVRVYEDADDAVRRGVVTPFVANFMYKRRVAEVILDVCLVSIAYYSAWRLRYEGAQWGVYFPYFLRSLPIVLAVQMVTLFIIGAYRGIWRYFGLMDGVVFTKAVLVGTVCIVAIVSVNRFPNYSLSVFVIYAALLMLMLGASRASFRLIGEYVRRRRAGTRLVIYGAGDAGSVIMLELLNDDHESYRMLGFVDDDPAKHRLRLHGYRVLGGHQQLLSLIETGGVDAIVISVREIDAGRLHTLESMCLAGRVRLARARVSLEELVGRT
jgi:UDP-GlcNAc:undecaprenyl-phosphate GlcNAc-1-phosphate transferase